MKKQIRNVSLSVLTMLALSACATTVIDQPSESKITSIRTFISGGTVRPEFRRLSTTTLNSDLMLTNIVKNHKGATLSSKQFKITQAQFDNIIKDIDAANLSKLKPKPGLRRAPPPSGMRGRTVSIETNTGSHTFSNRGNYPDVIRNLYKKIEKLTYSSK